MLESTDRAPTVDAVCDALIQEGVRRAREGRYDKAELPLRRALKACAGSRSETESRACLNLGTLYGIAGRCFEALLLYRHGLSIALALGHRVGSVIYLANIGGIYVQLGRRSRLPGVLSRIDELLGEMEPAERRQAEPYALWQRYEVAADEHNPLATRVALDRIREEFGNDDDPRVRAAIEEIVSYELQEEGRLREATDVLEHALQSDELPPATRLDLLRQRATLLERRGRRAEVEATGREALQLLEEVGTDHGLIEETIHVARGLARSFERCGGAVDLTRRAYDLAATAMLRRMHQIDECVRTLPELGVLDAEDRSWMGDLRREFEADQEDLRAHAMAFLEKARLQGHSPLHAENPQDDLVRICAWCGTVRSRSDQWVPIRQYLPSDDHLKVTHSICPPCKRSLEQEAR